MLITIRKAQASDAMDLAYVHFTAWGETYSGLIDEAFLSNRKMEWSQILFSKIYANHYVAIVDDKLVGFAGYGQARDCEMDGCCEVMGIYILKEYHKMGIGQRLMDACFAEMKEYKAMIVWVLESNTNAILFYERLGFVQDGTKKEEILGKPVVEVRLIKHQPY